MKRILFLSVIVAAFGAAAIAFACTAISIPTDKSKLAFAKKALTAPAGQVVLNSTNMALLRHNIAIRNGTAASSKLIVQGKTVGKNGVSTATATLKKGKYRYLCTVPGHEAAGMWGILTVK